MYARLLLAAAAVGFAASAGAQQGKDEQKMLEGTWIPAEVELAGKKSSLPGTKLVLAGNKYTILSNDVVSDRGTVQIDPEKKPKAMDIKGEEGPNKGKTFPAIYELKDDTLTICYDLSGKQRPTEFKTTRENKHFLVTYKRAKP